MPTLTLMRPTRSAAFAISLLSLGLAALTVHAAVTEATSPEKLAVLPGFKIELVRTAQSGEGSWVALATDNKGRLIVSPQHGRTNGIEGGLLRFTLAPDGSIAKSEVIAKPVFDAQGLLYAFDSLYIVINKYTTKFQSGLYRVRETADGVFTEPELLRKIQGNGEHGPHGLVLGPDNKLYMVCGNFVDVPADILPTSPHRNYADDLVLPRAEDGNGFGAGRKPPGGFVLRMDRDGNNAELFASGQRNTYDIGFNADGELFGFDSDMEWDWGMPWYRPTRIYHLVSGGDQGFREGSGKWPEYYFDSLPAVVNIGVGSPTGVKFGTASKYPAKYQKAFFAMDWSYGRILAMHPMPRGASYTATFENFVSPKTMQEKGGQKTPFNVTDLDFASDGAMYFTTGGRGTQSGLYRVSYVGGEAPQRSLLNTPNLKEAADLRELRHQLEAFHGRQDAKAVKFAWPHLNSKDRWIRYAARLAIESQPVAEWKKRALEETKVEGGLTALLALARLGGKETQRDLLLALKKFPLESLNEEQRLEKYRLLEVSFARQGKPEADLAKMAIEKLDAHYPEKSWPLNRELSQILIALEAPGVVQKTLALLRDSKTQEEQIQYAFSLRNLKTGWTTAQRQEYFGFLNSKVMASQNAKLSEPHYPGTVGAPLPISNDHIGDTAKWFADVGQNYRDGSSFPKFIANIRKDAVASLSDEQRSELAPIITGQAVAIQLPQPRQRTFVKEWKMEDLLPDLDQVSKGRNFRRGRQAFIDGQCILCHRLGNEGGSVGPELAAASSKYTRRDILESIIEPSKVVSEQYQNSTFSLKSGDDVTGRLLEETTDKVIVITEPIKQLKMEIKKSDIAKRAPAKLSPMPTGLVDGLPKAEILDLIAYIEAAGKSEAGNFKP